MADITAEAVKRLRERTGAGMMDCKRALDEAGGDVDKAVAVLRERGLAAAAKKAGREAREGLISSYIHTGGRVGVLIEVNCETDFVARNDQFQELVRALAIQVAGLSPRWVDVDADPGRRARDEAIRAGAGPEPSPRSPPRSRRRSSMASSRSGSRRSSSSSSRTATRSAPSASWSTRPSPRSARTSRSGGSRATPSGRTGERRLARGRGTSARAYAADPAQAVRRGPSGRAAVRRRSRGLRVHRAPGRGGPRPRRRGRHRGRRRQHLPRPAGSGPGHGPRDGRLHRHARDRHERPRAPGRRRADGHARPA